MNKSWSKQFVACILSVVFLLASFVLTIAVLTGKTMYTSAVQADTFIQQTGRITSSNTIYGFIPFHFTGSSDDIVETTDSQDNKNYLSYIVADKDIVSFEQDLAFAWKLPDEQDKTKSQEKLFSFTFKMNDTNFNSVKFKLESTAINASKAGKVSNSIEIDNKGTVRFNDSEVGSITVDLTKDITIKFVRESNAAYNTFAMHIENNGNNQKVGNMEGVANLFTSYSSSRKVKIIPLQLETNLASGQTTKILMKSLNEQSFEVKQGSGHTLQDSAEPAVIPYKQIVNFVNGTSFDDSFNYRVMDIMNLTLTATAYLGTDDTTDMDKFRENNKIENRGEGKTFTDGKSIVHAFVTLSKYTTDSSGEQITETTDINLKWYAENEQEIALVEPIARDATAYPTMNWSDTNFKTFQDATITATGYGSTANGGIHMPMGSGAYLYFGNLTGIVNNNISTDASNARKVPIQNIQYTVYYRVNGSSSVQTGRTAANSDLYLEINPSEGMGPFNYEIILVPQYTIGNTNYGMMINNEPVNANNVFSFAQDSNNKQLLRVLSFQLTYSGPELNNATSTQAGYVGSTYTASDIDVIGLDNKAAPMETTYTLYQLIASSKSGITRDSIYEEMKKLRANETSKIAPDEATYNQNKDAYIGYLQEIKEDDGVHNWNPKTKSFTPRSESFYIVQAKAIIFNQESSAKYAYQAVDVLSRADTNKGNDPTWVQRNLASIILFSISGALLIVLLLLIFLPDKNKKSKKLIGATAGKTKNSTLGKGNVDKTNSSTNNQNSSSNDILEKYKHLLKK